MPFRIQRVPQGLLNLLSITGGLTPTELEDRVRANVDVLQMYGLQQRQKILANDAALTENNTVGATLPGWGILFTLNATVIKTATMTALRAAVMIQLPGLSATIYKSEELGPFGATETGAASCCFSPPYPFILPIGSSVHALLQILGTDANANVTVTADVGILS